MDEVVGMYSSFLKWRRENDVDRVRHDILYGGKNTPFLFPFGKVIIDLVPQIIITPLARDYKDQPLALEQYCFSPKEVLKTFTLEQYLIFLTYALEFRSLVLEQLSHEIEKKYVTEHGAENNTSYGVVLLDFTIRDMKGLSLAHIGAEGRALVRAALNLGLGNYPECLGKCHIINVPWVFNSMWYFIKAMLDEQTLEKISLSGADNLNVLLKDMSLENIPTSLGGQFASYNEPFLFDLSPGGPFHYENIENDLQRKYPSIWAIYKSGSCVSIPDSLVAAVTEVGAELRSNSRGNQEESPHKIECSSMHTTNDVEHVIPSTFWSYICAYCLNEVTLSILLVILGFWCDYAVAIRTIMSSFCVASVAIVVYRTRSL